MKTILLPTDFSENARRSYLYAVTLFGKDDTQYILTHAYPVPRRDTEIIIASMKNGVDAEVKQSLDNELAWLHRKTGVSSAHIKTLSYMGSLVDAIDHSVHEYFTDFIVMGTKGATGLKEVFMGSHTYSVIEHVPRPVIALPLDAKRKKPESITLAVDITIQFTPDRLTELIELAQSLSAKITVLTIHPEVKNMNARSFQASIKQALGPLFHKFIYKESAQVAESLESYVKMEQPDMLCLLPNRSGFFHRLFKGSVTQKLAFHSHIPILAIP